MPTTARGCRRRPAGAGTTARRRARNSPKQATADQSGIAGPPAATIGRRRRRRSDPRPDARATPASVPGNASATASPTSTPSLRARVARPTSRPASAKIPRPRASGRGPSGAGPPATSGWYRPKLSGCEKNTAAARRDGGEDARARCRRSAGHRPRGRSTRSAAPPSAPISANGTPAANWLPPEQGQERHLDERREGHPVGIAGNRQNAGSAAAARRPRRRSR